MGFSNQLQPGSNDATGATFDDFSLTAASGPDVLFVEDFERGSAYAWSGATPFACTAPPSSMIGWRPGDGTADDIAGSHAGAIHGGVIFGTGTVGQAFGFTGSGSEYVTTGTFSLGTHATVDAWLRPSVLTGGFSDNSIPGLLRRYAAGAAANGLDLTIGLYDGKLGSLYKPVSGDITALLQAQSPTVVAGHWYHVAITIGGTTARLYVDGILRGSAPTQSDYVPDSHFQIGAAFCCGTDSLGGQVDEVEVFDRALSQAEVQAIADAGVGGKCKP